MGRDKLANGEQQKIVETHLNSHTVASIDFNAYSRQNLKSHRETRTADRQNGKENRRTKYLIQSHLAYFVTTVTKSPAFARIASPIENCVIIV